MRAHTFREHSAEGGSAGGRLSHCSLQGRIKHAEKPGPVPVGQRSRSAGVRSQLPQVPGYLSTGERITYIRQCPLFANRGDASRAFFEAACCQRDIRGDAYVGSRDVLCNPVVGRVCAFTHQNHTHVRGAWRPDRSRAVGDDQNIEAQARRHAVDLLPHRACITIDVDFSQLPVRCLSTLAIPRASTTAALLGRP
jgi:hypothetical protein